MGYPLEAVSELQPRYIYLSFMDYNKAFDCVDHNKLWTTLKEMGIPDDLTVSWETSMLVKKQQLELGMEHLTGSDWERSATKLFIVTVLI